MLKIFSSAIRAGPILYILQATTGPPASAADRQIQFTNTTRLAVVELYASYVGTGNWQQDILGEDFLQPGNSLIIDINDWAGRCRFDFKAVFDDGTALIRRDINICEVEKYALSYR